MMRAQAFMADAFLALVLALILSQMMAPQQASGQDYKQLRLVRACYDISNAFYADNETYGAVASSLNSSGQLSNSSLWLLHGRLSSYGTLLELSAVDFEVMGIQKEHVQISGAPVTHTERCCFPIVANSEGRAYVACLEVSA